MKRSRGCKRGSGGVRLGAVRGCLVAGALSAVIVVGFGAVGAQAAPFVYVANASGNVSQYELAPAGCCAALPGHGGRGLPGRGGGQPGRRHRLRHQLGAPTRLPVRRRRGRGARAQEPAHRRRGRRPRSGWRSARTEAASTSRTPSSDSVSQYDVGAGGALTPKSPATVAAGDGPFGVAVSPDGGSVYVTNCDGDNVSQYDVGARAGRSHPRARPRSPPAAPRRGGGQPGRRRASTSRTSASDTVSQYDVGAGGALTPKSPATVAAGNAPARGGGEPGRRQRLRHELRQRQRLPVRRRRGRGAHAQEPGHGRRGRPEGVAVSPDGASVYVANSRRRQRLPVRRRRGRGASPKSPATVAAGDAARSAWRSARFSVPDQQGAVQERRLAQLPQDSRTRATASASSPRREEPADGDP